MNNDLPSIFRSRIDGMLIAASWLDGLRVTVGVTGVSQIWEAAPAWYFWLVGIPGPYELRLEHAWEESGDGSSDVRALFSVKWYPRKESSLFHSFSFPERALAGSALFDETHTPRYELREQIPPSLFLVGTLEWHLNLDHCGSALILESPEIMRTRYESDVCEEYAFLGTDFSFTAGEVGRSVPGWEISHVLFDRLVSLWAYHLSAGPRRVTVSSENGFEHVCTGSGVWECRESQEITIRTLEVVFEDEGSNRDRPSPLEPAAESRGASIVFDQDFGGMCPHSVAHCLRGTEYVNALWWSIPEAQFTSSLTSTCGCH